MSYPQSTDEVLIVGAGPTGLTLAHELLRHGIRPRLIEKTLTPSPNTKALGVMARTLELLAPSGITQTMIAQGLNVPVFSIASSGRHLASFDFTSGIESPYPYILMIPQHTTEAILTEHILHLGGTVERGSELVSLIQHPDSVEAVIRRSSGADERIKVSFVVGCDGAHSSVRRLLGAPFVGTTVEQGFTTGNVRMHWDLPGDQAFFYLNRGCVMAYFPLPDGVHHRFLLTYQPGEEPQGEVTLEEIQRAIDICGPQGSRASDPGWLARYHVHQRKVERYIHERVILAGDAAHIHSPLGAQGMNTGMQDAINLAWKLALVVQGRAPACLLESYQIERSAVGEQVLQDDELLTRQMFMRHPLATATRDQVTRCLSQISQSQQVITSTAAELHISYHDGPLVAEYHGVKSKPAQVKVGDRAPDGPIIAGQRRVQRRLYDQFTGMRHVLLMFMHTFDEMQSRRVQSQLSNWCDMLDIYPVMRKPGMDEDEQALYDLDGLLAKRYGITGEGLVLIRPDGYISFRGQPIAGEPLQRFLCTHYSSSASSRSR